MKKYFLLIILGIISVLISCENNDKRKAQVNKSVDYSDKSVLDSIINATPHSKEEMFLGFTIGMTKEDYKEHIAALIEAGKKISYSKSNRISSIAGNFDLGAAYSFKTDISSNSNGTKLTGEGQYLLEPIYNKEDKLIKLNILPMEEWNGDYGQNKPKWLGKNILENSRSFDNKALIKILMEKDLISDYNIREKNNLIIYENMLLIQYTDLKTLLTELRNTEIGK